MSPIIRARVVDGIITRIMYRMPVRWIINRWYATINWIGIIWRYIVSRRIIYWSIIVTHRKMDTWFKIPCVIGIKMKMTRMIISIYIDMTVDHDVIFINFLMRWFTLITIYFLNRLTLYSPKPGITACQGNEQCQKNGALE
jgi:hypothetical protein